MFTQKQLLLGLIIFIVVTMAYFVGQNSKSSTDPRSNETTVSPHAAIEEQKMLTTNQSNCAVMEKNIVDNNGSSASNQFYTSHNHYNLSMAKCFVELDQTVILNNTVTVFNSIWDAVENQVVGRCVTKSPVGAISDSCTKLSPTIDQFNTTSELRMKYMYR